MIRSVTKPFHGHVERLVSTVSRLIAKEFCVHNQGLKMLNKKESLLRRDQAISWLWACRKAGFNRDVARLVTNYIFDGFHYLNGNVTFGFVGWLNFENGRLNGRSSNQISYNPTISAFCQKVIASLAFKKFIIDGRDATVDEVEAIVDVLRFTNCGISIVMIEDNGRKTKCGTFGDVLNFQPNPKWIFYAMNLKKLRIKISE